MDLLQEMKDSEVRRTVVTYNAAISACDVARPFISYENKDFSLIFLVYSYENELGTPSKQAPGEARKVVWPMKPWGSSER